MGVGVRLVAAPGASGEFRASLREEGLPEAHAEMPSAAPSPLMGVLDTEARRQLARAMEGLSAEQRAVFVLRVFDELSYKEIAETLEISIGTVMSRLARARRPASPGSAPASPCP